MFTVPNLCDQNILAVGMLLFKKEPKHFQTCICLFGGGRQLLMSTILMYSNSNLMAVWRERNFPMLLTFESSSYSASYCMNYYSSYLFIFLKIALLYNIMFDYVQISGCHFLWSSRVFSKSFTNAPIIQSSSVKLKPPNKVWKFQFGSCSFFFFVFFAYAWLENYTVYCVCKYYIHVYQMTALSGLQGVCLFWFGVAYKLQLASYSLKIVSKDAWHSHLDTYETSVHVL